MGGAASGKYEVKACGKAHAWCSVCRPEVAQGQRKPKPPNPDLPPCRNCGKCDACLGLTALEGMKVCRICGKAKRLAEFPRRADTGGYRNQCKACRHGGGMEPRECQGCGKWIWRYRTLAIVFCAKCKPSPTKPCARCGKPFARTRTQHDYCSPECRTAAQKQKRDEAAKALREQLIEAYGGKCTCPRCPETNPAFLTLEHVNGTGKAHREIVGSHAYADLRRRGWPKDGFTLLCFNCNLATRFGRTCPHMEQALAVAG
jgi:hypothetical protein